MDGSVPRLAETVLAHPCDPRELRRRHVQRPQSGRDHCALLPRHRQRGPGQVDRLRGRFVEEGVAAAARGCAAGVREAAGIEITNRVRTPVPALRLPKCRSASGSGTAALNILDSR